MNNGLLEVGEKMVKGDIFTMPIVFALQETMKQFENYDNDNDKMIYESLRRSKAIWENIKIHGLEIYGMTYEQFCDQCDKKRNIVFLADDEIEDFNKAVEIMNIMMS